jgi:hypothetical protein
MLGAPPQRWSCDAVLDRRPMIRDIADQGLGAGLGTSRLTGSRRSCPEARHLGPWGAGAGELRRGDPKCIFSCLRPIGLSRAPCGFAQMGGCPRLLVPSARILRSGPCAAPG